MNYRQVAARIIVEFDLWPETATIGEIGEAVQKFGMEHGLGQRSRMEIFKALCDQLENLEKVMS